jgi:predicted permease
VVLPASSYNPQRRVDFFSRLEASLDALPGVDSVASMSGLPPTRSVDAADTDFEHIPNNQPPDSPLPIQNVDYWQYATARYTDTMGIPIVKGRGFEQADVAGAPVVLVNEALVARFFTSQKRDPIGGRIKPGFDEGTPFFTVVGVVKDVKQAGVDAPVGSEMYLLSEQGPRLQIGANSSMNVVVRTREPLSVLAPSIERAVRAIDAGLPIVKLRTMDEVFGDSVARPRFITLLLGIFAALALLLAAVGIYGVLSYLVTQRAQEIGIRMALGADRRSVLGLVLGQGLRLAAIGLVLGTVAALATGRLIASLLFAISPADPVTIGAVVLTIAAIATGACLIPALRATRVDPITSLRT